MRLRVTIRGPVHQLSAEPSGGVLIRQLYDGGPMPLGVNDIHESVGEDRFHPGTGGELLELRHSSGHYGIVSIQSRRLQNGQAQRARGHYEWRAGLATEDFAKTLGSILKKWNES